MRLVLDSNEYIYGFGAERKPECEGLILRVAEKAGRLSLFVPRMVADEVERNVSGAMFKAVHHFWREMGCSIDDDHIVPGGMLASYLKRGLKDADAMIGAYTEWVRADALVSENRDFLALSNPLPFRVMKASTFLKEKSGRPKK